MATVSNNSKNYSIYTIGILALTNIPGSTETHKITYESLNDGTRTIGQYSAHPFFMDEVSYPYAVLARLTRREMLAFFFHEPTFISTISTHLSTSSSSATYCREINKYTKNELSFGDVEPVLALNTKETEISADSKMRIAICNLWCMIRLLFPTEFPVSCNVASSFLNYIKSKQIISNSFSSTPIINMSMFMKTAPINAQIKIGNNTYTVAKTTWLDDMVNHPVYTKLISEYNFLIQWCANKKPINEKVYNLLKKKIDANLEILRHDTNNIVSENATFMKPEKLTTYNSRSQTIMYGDNTDAADYVIAKINSVFTNKDETELKNVASSISDTIDKIFANATDIVNSIYDIETIPNVEKLKKSSTKRQSVNFNIELDAIDDIFQKIKSAGRLSLSSQMNTILTQLQQLIKKYRTLIYVNNTYLSGIINAGFKNDDKLTPELMKIAEIPTPFYPEYLTWIETIRKITSAAQDTPMINPDLAKLFVSFIEEADVGNNVKDTENKFNSCMKLAAGLLNNTTRITNNDAFKNLFIGMNRLPFAHESKVDYELYLSMDLIGGVIDATNRGNTECRYKDASIGDYIENIATSNPNIARPAQFFVKAIEVAPAKIIS